MSGFEPKIAITHPASIKITDIIANEPNHPCFRIKIQGGGCRGFEYVFGLDNQPSSQDFSKRVSSTDEGFTLVVDPISHQFLAGAKIDYIADTNGERFLVTNPDTQTTCSCGSSFSPKEQEG